MGMCGAVSGFFGFSSRLGRRYSMILLQYLIALFCLVLGGLTFVTDEMPWKSFTIVVLTIIGKGFTAATSGGQFLFTVELFPTVLRVSAIGFLGLMGRIGSQIAPQFLLLVRLGFV